MALSSDQEVRIKYSDRYSDDFYEYRFKKFTRNLLYYHLNLISMQTCDFTAWVGQNFTQHSLADRDRVA